MGGYQSLMKRCEEQAVEIARLRTENEYLATTARTAANGAREMLLSNMANCSVNCGPNSGCWLAKRYLENYQDKKTHEERTAPRGTGSNQDGNTGEAALGRATESAREWTSTRGQA